MLKQCAADTTAHRLGLNPQMLQAQVAPFGKEHVEADDLAAFACRIRFVCCDKLRRNRQNISPLLDPILGIAPMAFCRKRNSGEDNCVVRRGTDDLHAANSRHEISAGYRRSPVVAVARERIETHAVATALCRRVARARTPRQSGAATAPMFMRWLIKPEAAQPRIACRPPPNDSAFRHIQRFSPST